MRIDRRSVYNTAVGEIDAPRVQRLCDYRAQRAIIDRLIDLAPMSQDGTVTAEREELEEASRKLAPPEHALPRHPE